MATQGHFNHLDDPDEFWDDEPLEIRHPKPTPVVPDPKPSAPQPSPGVPSSSSAVPRASSHVPPPSRTVPDSPPSSSTTTPGMDSHDLIGNLNRLQRRVEAEAAEYEWIDRVSRTMERPGRDPSGAVQTKLDEHNLPEQFIISRDWQSRLIGRRLDAAIMEAVGVAYADGWRKATAEVKSAREKGEQPPLSNQFVLPDAPSDRPLEEIIEDILAVSSKPAAVIGRGEPEPAVSGDTRIRFEFTDYGIAACRIDQDWAERRAAGQLATEINTQLITQRDQFVAGKALQPGMNELLAATEQLVGLLQHNNLNREP